jgi:hypothetical protein
MGPDRFGIAQSRRQRLSSLVVSGPEAGAFDFTRLMGYQVELTFQRRQVATEALLIVE